MQSPASKAYLELELYGLGFHLCCSRRLATISVRLYWTALLDGYSCDDASVRRFCSDDGNVDGRDEGAEARIVKILKATNGAEAHKHDMRVVCCA